MERFSVKEGVRRGKGPWRFVESVRVREERRIGWRTALVTAFWVLVLIKCLLAHWAVVHWKMPFDSAWVWGPTVGAAIVCTVVFLAGPREE